MTAVFLPLMTIDQPDTAERVRLAVQSIPFALPEKALRRSLTGSFRLGDGAHDQGLNPCADRPKAAAATQHSKYEGSTLCP